MRRLNSTVAPLVQPVFPAVLAIDVVVDLYRLIHLWIDKEKTRFEIFRRAEETLGIQRKAESFEGFAEEILVHSTVEIFVMQHADRVGVVGQLFNPQVCFAIVDREGEGAQPFDLLIGKALFARVEINQNLPEVIVQAPDPNFQETCPLRELVFGLRWSLSAGTDQQQHYEK